MLVGGGSGGNRTPSVIKEPDLRPSAANQYLRPVRFSSTDSIPNDGGSRMTRTPCPAGSTHWVATRLAPRAIQLPIGARRFTEPAPLHASHFILFILFTTPARPLRKTTRMARRRFCSFVPFRSYGRSPISKRRACISYRRWFAHRKRIPWPGALGHDRNCIVYSFPLAFSRRNEECSFHSPPFVPTERFELSLTTF
jgi:hypothetical protein